MDSLWYAGVCDSILRKVDWWMSAWEQGDVYATRPWVRPVDGAVIQVPTKRVVRIPWTKAELRHLVRILEQVKPNWFVNVLFKTEILPTFEKYRMVPPNQRLIPVATFYDDVVELRDLLVQAKTGRTSLNQEVEKVLIEKKDGPLWG